MKRWLAVLALMLAVTAPGLGADGGGTGFETDAAGSVPDGWQAGLTGRGSSHWEVTTDDGAPSPPHVLLQSGRGSFPWIVRGGAQLKDGFVETRFKPLSGSQDQAGGLVWRFKDGDSYYVARANALENNVSLYYVTGGSRRTLQYVDAPVSRGAWHLLRVEFSGRTIRVLLDGTLRIAMEDDHLSEAGLVGLWTKADSVTAFDDFRFGALAEGSPARRSSDR